MDKKGFTPIILLSFCFCLAFPAMMWMIYRTIYISPKVVPKMLITDKAHLGSTIPWGIFFMILGSLPFFDINEIIKDLNSTYAFFLFFIPCLITGILLILYYYRYKKLYGVLDALDKKEVTTTFETKNNNVNEMNEKQKEALKKILETSGLNADVFENMKDVFDTFDDIDGTKYTSSGKISTSTRNISIKVSSTSTSSGNKKTDRYWNCKNCGATGNENEYCEYCSSPRNE